MTAIDRVVPVVVMSYDALDKEFGDLSRELASLTRKALSVYIRMGEICREMRQLLPHGEYGSWLQKHGMSYASASAWVNAIENFKTFELSEDAWANFVPSAFLALGKPSTPEDARIKAVEMAASGQTITMAVAQELRDRFRQDERFQDLAVRYEAADLTLRPTAIPAWPYVVQAQGINSLLPDLEEAEAQLPILAEQVQKLKASYKPGNTEGYGLTGKLPNLETNDNNGAASGDRSSTDKPSRARIANDFYPTRDAKPLVEALTKHVKITGQIFEPFAGDGAIAELFYGSITNDLVVYPGFICDYYLDACDPSTWDVVDEEGGFDWAVSNPSFEVAPIALPHALRHARKGVAFLLRLSYMEPCQNRADWLREYADCMTNLITLNPRPKFRSDTEGSDKVTVAWMAWQPAFSWKSLGLTPPFAFENWERS